MDQVDLFEIWGGMTGILLHLEVEWFYNEEIMSRNFTMLSLWLDNTSSGAAICLHWPLSWMVLGIAVRSKITGYMEWTNICEKQVGSDGHDKVRVWINVGVVGSTWRQGSCYVLDQKFPCTQNAWKNVIRHNFHDGDCVHAPALAEIRGYSMHDS